MFLKETPVEVWRGRLSAALDPRAKTLNDSLSFDARLWREELALSRAYAASLMECGILSRQDVQALADAAESLKVDLEAGRAILTGEDVHSAVESELIARCGDAARRLHTGRSRNDQVATLLRLKVMRFCDEAVAGIRDLEKALITQARRSEDIAVAGSTHLQPAQPLLLAHIWLSHVEALKRDEDRFQTARETADQLPLGAGAMAGTPLRYDRLTLASRLGFSRIADNSLDAVSDRDFALEYLNAAMILGIHLSRLSEDLVLWCSPAFGWFTPPDGFSTGSSLLPQKRNPDVFELARAKAGRLISNAERLAIVMKGLPSSYQKDLQEDKEAVFDTADTVAALLAALPKAIEVLEPRVEAMSKTLSVDLLAVELADQLVDQGLPFREAHALVGRLWALSEESRVSPLELPLEQRLAISSHFTTERLASLSIRSALERRNHSPGTGPLAVAAQLARAEERLGLGPRLMADRTPSPVSAPARVSENGVDFRRASMDDVPAMARMMAALVADGTLLPRPMNELYQSVREFHVAVRRGEVVACAGLRLLWGDLGEVRSLVVRPNQKGNGLGRTLVERLIEDGRSLGLCRVIALTREVAFFERCGFRVIPRESLPRKVWTDCVHCPRRHACDETAVVYDLVEGATERALADAENWVLPLPPAARTTTP